MPVMEEAKVEDYCLESHVYQMPVMAEEVVDE